jgi:hypothetical protein
MFELEDFDARFGRVEDPFLLERAGHLALQTARALLGVYQQGFQHRSPPFLRLVPRSCHSI